MIRDPIGILADDLTGANDTGAQFSRLGARVLVIVSLNRPPKALERRWDAVVLNTGSRNLPPGEARSRVAAALALLRRWGIPLVYKKIDSTLRGPWVAELRELLDRGVDRAYVAPAFPLNGRTVEAGVLKVAGVPVHETEAARDGLSPVLNGYLPSLLEEQLGMPIGTLDSRTGPGAESGAGFQSCGRGSHRVVVCDARDQADLARLAEVIAPDLPGPLLVGSAGWARELAVCLLAGTTRKNSAERRSAEYVLVVAGSRSEVTRSQVRRLRRSGPVAEAEIGPERVDGSWNPDRALELAEDTVNRLAAHLNGNAPSTDRAGTVLVSLGPGEPDVPRPHFQQRSGRLNQVLGLVVAQWLRRWPDSALVLTGGDVAAAGIEALGVEGIELGEEILPGIPMGWLSGGGHAGLPIVTKAGAFGAEDALVRAVESLHAARGGDAEPRVGPNSQSGQLLP